MWTDVWSLAPAVVPSFCRGKDFGLAAYRADRRMGLRHIPIWKGFPLARAG